MHDTEDVGDGHGLDIIEREAVIFTVGRVAEKRHGVGILWWKYVNP